MPRTSTGAVLERKTKRGRVFALRFTAYGHREYVTLGTAADGWTRKTAAAELDRIMAAVKLGIWQSPRQPEVEEDRREVPTFHVFASQWFAARRGELRQSTRLAYEWELTHHLLPLFAEYRLDQIDVALVDRYRHAKVAEERLSPSSINKILGRLAQILEVAVEYDHIARNPARGRNRRLKAPRPRSV